MGDLSKNLDLNKYFRDFQPGENVTTLLQHCGRYWAGLFKNIILKTELSNAVGFGEPQSDWI